MTEPDSSRPDDVFDLDRLQQLIELMKEHALTEVDLRHENQRIRLRRGPSGSHHEVGPPMPPPTAYELSSTPVEPEASDGDHIVTIVSPMVGTFYSGSNPEAEPFVRVGDTVGPESVVCIIEAMKVFNEILAEVTGQILAVLVENEESVEFGKALFKVDTSK